MLYHLLKITMKYSVCAMRLAHMSCQHFVCNVVSLTAISPAGQIPEESSTSCSVDRTALDRQLRQRPGRLHGPLPSAGYAAKVTQRFHCTQGGGTFFAPKQHPYQNPCRMLSPDEDLARRAHTSETHIASFHAPENSSNNASCTAARQARADHSSRRPLVGALAGAVASAAFAAVTKAATAWFVLAPDIAGAAGPSVAAESEVALLAQPSAQLPHVCERQSCGL